VRLMSVSRLGVLTVCLLGLVSTAGVVQASAGGPTQVLMFHSGKQTQTAVGFNINSNTAPPVGSQYIITVVLHNAAPQFGKPTGAQIGRALIDCTFLSVSAPNGDGICSGIAHLPDGYVTFGGNGGFSNSKHGYWAVTGGVGHYAHDRGQLRTGGGTAVLTLYS
jgi:hypothetical protein